MTDPLLSDDPLAGLFLPKPETREQPAVFLTGAVVSVGSDEVVTVDINGTPSAVSVCSTVTYGDLEVGAQVAMLGIRVGGIATYMVFGIIDSPPLANRGRGGLRLMDIERFDDSDDGDDWLLTDHPGVRAIFVEVQAAGGTGGGSGATLSGEHSKGGGGGAGGYANALIFRDRLEALATLSIPSASVPPAAGASTGTAGGDCYFGTRVSALGGQGGPATASNATPFGVVGGVGGAGQAGDYLQSGNIGGHGFGSGSLSVSGHGANSRYGAGGRNRTTTGAGQANGGNDAQGYGAGGGGACTSSLGAAAQGGGGSGGLIVVRLYG